MEKKQENRHGRVEIPWQKMGMVMKLSLFFVLAIVFTAYGSVSSQNVKLHFENAGLRTVFKSLKKQTGIIFLYNEDNLDKGVKINVREEKIPLDKALDKIMRDLPYSYEFINDMVVIRKTDKPQSRQLTEGIKIRGRVTEGNGESVAGAYVLLKSNPKIGVTTDVDGNFELLLPGNLMGNDRIVFSFLGMKKQELPIDGRESYEVVLQEDKVNMDEVVVTGYQTLSRERVTGSYDIVSRDQLDKPTPNIASRLVGTVAGVQATLDENGDPTFQIRGKSSLYADAQPLIVVDGFPIEGDFKSINPNDVESITILKDAAAASIWGARSANGVIVITTKNAGKLKKGELQVNVSSFVRFSPKTDLDYTLSRASSADAVEYDKLSYAKWGASTFPDGYPRFMSKFSPGKVALNEHVLGYLSDEELEKTLSRYANLDNSGQIKKYMLQNPFVHQHNMSVSSASERSNHYLSLMYEGRKLNLKGNEGEKYVVTYKTNIHLYKWLDFNFSGTYVYDNATDNSTGLPQLNRYEMLVDEQGNRLPVNYEYYMPNILRNVPMDQFPYNDWTYNPVTETEERDLTTRKTNIRFQGGISLKLIEGLTLRGDLKYERNDSRVRNYYGEGTYQVRNIVNTYTYWDRGTNTFTLNIPKGAILDQSRNEVDVLNLRYQLNLNRTFGKHTVAMVAGSEIIDKKIRDFGYTRTYGYNDETLSVGKFPNGLGSYTNNNLKIKNWLGYNTTIYEGVDNSFGYFTNRFFSLYGNASYTYDSRYTISASARTDASNLITDDPEYRYQPMWSVGGSWLASEEKFLKGQEWIDRLVVRVTYGYNGNVDNSTSFKPLIQMNATNNSYTQESYGNVSSYGNPTLRWEKTGVFNLGADYSFRRGKLTGKIDYYRKDAKDLIARVSIPAVNGTTSQKINAANMVNHGIEAEIGTTLPVAGELTWQGNANVAYNKNKITKLFTASFSHSELIPWNATQTAFVEGKNANTIYGLKYAGLRDVGTPNSPNQQPHIADKNGNIYGLASWPTGNPLDYCYDQGTTVAPWILGFSNTFRYKGWDLSLILTGKFGHVFRRESYNYNSTVPNAKLSEVLHGDPDKIMPLPQNDKESRYYFWNRFWPFFTYLTESANHIRMQEIALRYTAPSEFTRKIGIRSVQLYGMVNNVFSIYANKFDEDPEFVRGSLKPAPYFTFGVKIGL